MNYSKLCACKEWFSNISAIDWGIQFLEIHGIKWNALPFKYCPWCGKELVSQNLYDEFKQWEKASEEDCTRFFYIANDNTIEVPSKGTAK